LELYLAANRMCLITTRRADVAYSRLLSMQRLPSTHPDTRFGVGRVRAQLAASNMLVFGMAR
jgi:hypothetical protein